MSEKTHFANANLNFYKYIVYSPLNPTTVELSNPSGFHQDLFLHFFHIVIIVG